MGLQILVVSWMCLFYSKGILGGFSLHAAIIMFAVPVEPGVN